MLNEVVIANNSYIKLEISENQAMDSIALEVMKQDCPDFLLPVKTMERDGNMEMRFSLSTGIRMKYLPSKIAKRDFVAMMIGLLTPFKTCDDWFMDYHYLYLDPQDIFISRDYHTVKYVYIPVQDYWLSDEQIKSFFEDFIVKTELLDEPAYTMDLFRELKKPNANLITLLNYIQSGSSLLGGNSGASDYGMPQPAMQTPSPQAPVQQPQQQWGQQQPFQPQQSQPVQQPAAKAPFQNPFQQPAKPAQQPAKPAQPPVKPAATVETGNGKKDGKWESGDDPMGGILAGLGGAAPAPAKHSKPEKPAKEQKAGGFLSGILGGGKNKGAEEDVSPLKAFGQQSKTPAQAQVQQQAPAAGRANNQFGSNAVNNQFGGQQGGFGNNQFGTQQPAMGMNNGYQQSAPYSPMNSGGGESTVIEDDGVGDPNTLYLALYEGAIGYDCPALVQLKLVNGVATIGRRDKSGATQTTYSFDSSLTFISRMHARVEKVNDTWQIIDLDSKGGTFLNGQKLMPNMAYPINPGDIVMFTSKHLCYRVSQS